MNQTKKKPTAEQIAHTATLTHQKELILSKAKELDRAFGSNVEIKHLIIQAPATAAERDRLKEVNGELLAALKRADDLLAGSHLIARRAESVDQRSEVLGIIRAAILRAEVK